MVYYLALPLDVKTGTARLSLVLSKHRTKKSASTALKKLMQRVEELDAPGFQAGIYESTRATEAGAIVRASQLVAVE